MQAYKQSANLFIAKIQLYITPVLFAATLFILHNEDFSWDPRQRAFIVTQAALIWCYLFITILFYKPVILGWYVYLCHFERIKRAKDWHGTAEEDIKNYIEEEFE